MRTIMCCCASLLVFLASTTAIRSADTPAETSPAEQFAALTKEYEAKLDAFWKEYRTIQDEAKKGAFYGQHYPDPEKLYPQFLALAEKHKNDPIAIDAIGWIASNRGINPKEATKSRPFDLLLREHLASERLPIVFDSATDEFLRAVSEKSPHREVRGLALIALAEHRMGQIRSVRRYRDEHPGPTIEKLMMLRTSLAYYVNMDLDAATKEVETLLEQVVQEYGDVPIADRRNGKTVGVLAKNHLHEIRNLGIGMVAPELKSVTLDGQPVALADLKGKVVVLDVWATWCGPCLAMIPHEREMVKRLADKPFALVSISIDETPNTVKDFLAKEPMPWTHWYNGPTGSIIADLNVYSYPTIYVIDAKGVIRYKDIREKLLDAAVDILLKEVAEIK